MNRGQFLKAAAGGAVALAVPLPLERTASPATAETFAVGGYVTQPGPVLVNSCEDFFMKFGSYEPVSIPWCASFIEQMYRIEDGKPVHISMRRRSQGLVPA